MSEGLSNDAMLDMFLFENEQMMEQLEAVTLSKKDENSFDEQSINEVFRIMHTVKGSAGMMMFNNIATLSHALEDVFYYLREAHPNNVPHGELVGYMLEVIDFIKDEVDKIKSRVKADGDANVLISRIHEFLKELKSGVNQDKIVAPREAKKIEKFYIVPVSTADSKFYKILITYSSDTEMANIRAYSLAHSLKDIAEDLLYEPEDLIQNEASSEYIIEHGFRISLQTKSLREDIEDILSHGTYIESMQIDECKAEEFIKANKKKDNFQIDLDDDGIKVELASNEEVVAKNEKDVKVFTKADALQSMNDIKESSKKKQDVAATISTQKQSFISVNVVKMDALMDLVGELVIAEAMVLQNPDLKVSGLDLTNFSKAASQLNKITTELQDVIMAIRMMPLKNTFQKMNRIVYDICRKQKKDVTLDIVGADTEVDKNIIEHISDPLMHLIRNAIDHGIESNEERNAAGKVEKGKIILEAKSEGGQVWIIVKDNGKGLNKQKILSKAEANGFLGNRKGKDISEKEIFNFITLPGFSTKEQVTEYSGRGVGMDVVTKNIQSVGGSLDIDSVEGQGTTMIIKIPLTLAIIDGVIIGVGAATYVVSTNAVKEFIRIKQNQIILNPNGDEMVMIRGECYPVLRLNRYYNIKNAKDDVEQGIMALLEHEDKIICVFVDQLIGEQEIVVKPMPAYIQNVKGISGCTQLGDGSISLILDTASLMQ